MKLLVRMILLGIFAGGVYSQTQNLAAAQGQTGSTPDASGSAILGARRRRASFPRRHPKLDEIVERMIKQEHDTIAGFDLYRPIVETYIQVSEARQVDGHRSEVRFLFSRTSRLSNAAQVHSLIERPGRFHCGPLNRPGSWQMILSIEESSTGPTTSFSYSGREFLGEVRCYVFDVTPAPKVRGARFVAASGWKSGLQRGADQRQILTGDSFLVEKLSKNEYYLHFDSWRTNVKSGMWLPRLCLQPGASSDPRASQSSYKSSTHLWG